MHVHTACFTNIFPSLVVTRAAPMATAEDTGAKKAALEAKETLIDKMEEGVHEVPKHKTRAQKPRIGSMGARQTWDECLGENHSTPLVSTVVVNDNRVLAGYTHGTGFCDTEWLLFLIGLAGHRTYLKRPCWPS